MKGPLFSESVLLIICFMTVISCCKKEPLPPDIDGQMQNTTSADKIAGAFKGEGKYMPGQINLGTFEGCVKSTGWESKLKTGTTTTNIVKLTDSTVRIFINGTSFASIILSTVKVKTEGNSVNFPGGYYDINTKFLTLSSGTDKTFYSPECILGLPYVYGVKVFLTANTYAYQTIDHVEFSGSKQ